jgi:uncharacterized membrane protein YdjX (TVP38/TMEM64 family)
MPPSRRRALNFQIALFAIAIALLFVLSRYFPMVDVMTRLQQRVAQLGAWSVICYPLLFAFCNLLLLPGGILCVGSGFFFGLWWGFFLVLVGNVIAAAIAFAIGRSVGQEWFRNTIAQRPKLAALLTAVEHEGGKLVVLSQLHPLFPTSLLTYLFGLTRIPFRTYLLWVTIGRIPGLFLYVYVGTLGQFGLNLAKGKTHPRLVEYWIWGGAFLMTAILLVILSRIAIETIDNVRRSKSGEESAAAARHENSSDVRNVIT